MIGVLVKWGSLDTDTARREITIQRWYEDGREQSDASTSQGTPKIASNHQKLGEKHGEDSSSESLQGTDPAKILTSNC